MSLLSLPVELIENIVDKASEVPSTRSLGLFLITTKQLHPFGVKCLYTAPDFQLVREASRRDLQRQFRQFCEALRAKPSYAEAVVQLSFRFEIREQDSTRNPDVYYPWVKLPEEVEERYVLERSHPVFTCTFPNCKRMTVQWSDENYSCLPRWQDFLEQMYLFPSLECLKVFMVPSEIIELGRTIISSKCFGTEQRVDLTLSRFEADAEHAPVFWSSCVPWIRSLDAYPRSELGDARRTGIHTLGPCLEKLVICNGDIGFFDIDKEGMMIECQRKVCRSVPDIVELHCFPMHMGKGMLQIVFPRLQVLHLRAARHWESPEFFIDVSRTLDRHRFPVLSCLRLALDVNTRRNSFVTWRLAAEMRIERYLSDPEFELAAQCRKLGIKLELRTAP